jgi:putative ABC transport system permease protein
MGTLGTDLRDALRGLRAAPRFAAAAVALLATGIGATSATFGLVDAALVRSLPFAEPDRLVWVWATRTDRDRAFYSIPNFLDTRERCRGFDGLAAFANWGANFGGGDPERVQGVRITPHAFAVLGVGAAVGRTLEAGDAAAGNVVVLGHGLWRRRFGADPGVVGRTLVLDGAPYTVVGVLPPEFFFVGADAELAVPLRLDSDPRRAERGSNFLRVYGRLKPGVTPAEAARELAEATRYLRDAYPEENAKLTDPRVLALRDEVVGGSRAALLALFGAAAAVLLVACANLSGLALVRAIDRRREVAVRVALGAPPARVARLQVFEAILVALAGAAGGLAVAWAAVPAVAAAGFAGVPPLGGARLDVRAAAFAFAVTAVVALAVGLVSARVALRPDVYDALRPGGAPGRGGPRAPGRARNALVALEVAATLVLLVGAGLLTKTLARLGEVRPGYDPEGALAARLSLPPAEYRTAEDVAAYADRVVERLEQDAGMRSAALASVLPMSGMNARTDFRIAGRDAASPADAPGAQNRFVTPGYFRTMGIPLRAGRDFGPHDRPNSAGVAVVDEALARRFFPDADPVGAHLLLDDSAAGPREVEVVGVVGAVKHFALDEEWLPTVYSPLAQAPAGNLSFLAGNLNVVARAGPDAPAAAGLAREVRGVDPGVAVAAAVGLDETVARALGPRRTTARLVSALALVALGMAAVGLYAVIAYAVARGRREIAIRLALGAGPHQVLAAVLRPALCLAAVGMAAGLAAALALARLAEGLLFEVSPADPGVFAGAAAATAAVAALAAVLPARRALGIEPALTLRAE